MKKCIRCFEDKPISEYYKHVGMLDGLLSVCKTCIRARNIKRVESLKQNPDWVEYERERCRIKSRNKRGPVNLDKKKYYVRNYKERYPEKVKAAIIAHSVKCEIGYQKHHWSYQECDGRSLFFLKIKDHALVHRFLVYDQAAMKYRTKTGELLDTKEKHEVYINYILRNYTY